MKIRKNLIKLLFLGIFMLTMVFASSGIGVASEQSSQLDYEVGALLKAKGVQGGAVYQVGSDRRIYSYPGQKTFNTWHDDFSKVKEVAVSVLDEYDAGGVVTVQPGTNFVTNPDTAKVYLVGENGELTHIPNEATARKFYGDQWQKMVTDIDPGIFAISYRASKKVLTEDTIPDGSLVQVDDGDYFLIENGQKRKVAVGAFGINGLHRKNVLRIRNLPSIYNYGDEVDVEEEAISIFDPGADNTRVVICHKPDTVNRTIKVSIRALPAHLAHGDTRGACDDDDDDGDDGDEVSCDDPRITIGTPLGTTYWQDLGLDISAHPEIYQYQIQWFSGYWSPWYTPGVDDVDWKLSNRRVWSYFEDHNYRIKGCQGGDEPSLPDITVSDISVEPISPTVNATTTIKVHVKNSGSVTLTDTEGILNGFRDFEDFEHTSLPNIIPVITEDDPFEPGDTVYITWTAYFSSAGEKRLYNRVDNANELEESDETNNDYYEYVTVLEEEEDPLTLVVCDHNGDGFRTLADLAIFAGCTTTFDVNGDNLHNLVDLALYGSNNQDDAWCETNFVCVPEGQETEVGTLAICDHNSDSLRNLIDVAMFSQCNDTFDVNGDDLHNLTDTSLYASNNQDDVWCEANFVCNP
jgi:hypothetical protein